MSAVRIICDLNEEPSGIPLLLEGKGIEVTRRRLGTGDYVVSGALAIERKASTDFANSVISGRLLPQLDRLAATYDIAVLLIEGDKWAGNWTLKTPMLARLFQQITFRSNVIPWYSPDEKHTARFLAALAGQEQAQTVASVEELPAVAAARTPEEIVRALPGVGPKVAPKLLTRFGTVAAVMSASRDELCSALGSKRGNEVFDLLNRM